LAPFLLSAGLASLPVSFEVHGRLHEASRFLHDDREPPPVPLPPWVEQIPVDAAENPRVDHLDRPPGANPLQDGKAHLLGAEVRRDVE
jgi:hypothetical protein